MTSTAADFSHARYVFLDRDGVINKKAPEGEYISKWKDFCLQPGAESAIAQLNRSGRKIIVVSNQRGVALGKYTSADVDALHVQLQQHLAAHGAHIDAIYYCPHDKNRCDCRKPKPGLFKQALRDFPDASSANSVMIGDSISDIEVARNLHFASIYIQGDPATRRPGADNAAALADVVSDSLCHAVETYLL